MEINAKKWEYIFLKWVDSCWNSWWIHTDEEDIVWISTIYSVWIIFELTNAYITIIQSNQLDWDSIDNYINIPIVAITDFKILK